MRWIIKRLFWFGVLAAIVYYGAMYKVDGKPLKDYAREFYHSPLAQAALKAGKEMASEFWNEHMGSDKKSTPTPESAELPPVGDQLTKQDKEALNKVLEQQE